MSVTVTVFLDTRRIKKKTNRYPVKVRVTFDRKSQEYQTVVDLTGEDFNKLSASCVSTQLQETRATLKEIEFNASRAAKSLDPFSFEEFEKDYILNNPLFHQRNSIKKSVTPANYLFDRTLYQHRFPYFQGN